jgi:hypothetical protein
VRGIVPIEIARRQRQKEEDQAAVKRERAPPQHAPAGLVTALGISEANMPTFACRRRRLKREPARAALLRGRRLHLARIAAGVHNPSITSQILRRGSGRLRLRQLRH